MSLSALSNTAYDTLENRERLLFADIFNLNNELLMRQVSRLKPRVRQALELRYGLNDGTLRTYAGIGKIMGVGQERIRQLTVAGLHALRRWQRSRTFSSASHKWLSPGEIEKYMKEYQEIE